MKFMTMCDDTNFMSCKILNDDKMKPKTAST